MGILTRLITQEQVNLASEYYSRVRNKRGVRIIGGLEMVPYNNNRGAGIIGGGGVLGEIENSPFLR